MLKAAIAKLERQENLSAVEITGAMKELVSGQAAHDDISRFLLLMRAKSATVEEITAAAMVMREFWVPVGTKHKVILDTCGTGGDKRHTFNISTVVALIVAAAGVAVAKHGNRSVSSKCGSADILEALGVKLISDPVKLGQCLDQVGIAFLFAQFLHPAMKHVAVVRKELGVETVFNVLGPLINPAQNTHQMMGIYSRDLVEPIAQVLRNLGLKRALVVHGNDGLDEITTTDKTFVAEWNGRDIVTYDIEPQELGFAKTKLEDLSGGDLAVSVKIVNDILAGVNGPKRDIVVLNAGYALYAAGKVKDVTSGIKLAAQMLDSGKAREKLRELIEWTNK